MTSVTVLSVANARRFAVGAGGDAPNPEARFGKAIPVSRVVFGKGSLCFVCAGAIVNTTAGADAQNRYWRSHGIRIVPEGVANERV